MVGVPQTALIVQGELKTYTDKGDSGQPMYRRFCPECGSTVLDEAGAMPGMLMVQVGTLDDPSWVKPTNRRSIAIARNPGCSSAASGSASRRCQGKRRSYNEDTVLQTPNRLWSNR